MTLRELVPRGVITAAVIALLAPAPAQAQDTDPGNFTFHCPTCTTVGNASSDLYYWIGFDTDTQVDFWATGSAGDIFTVSIYGDPLATHLHTFDPWAGGGPNSVALLGTYTMLAGEQYYIGATGECAPPGRGCRLTLQIRDTDLGEPPPPAVPEPGTLLMMATGLVGLMGARRRRRL